MPNFTQQLGNVPTVLEHCQHIHGVRTLPSCTQQFGNVPTVLEQCQLIHSVRTLPSCTQQLGNVPTMLEQCQLIHSVRTLPSCTQQFGNVHTVTESIVDLYFWKLIVLKYVFSQFNLGIAPTVLEQCQVTHNNLALFQQSWINVKSHNLALFQQCWNNATLHTTTWQCSNRVGTMPSYTQQLGIVPTVLVYGNSLFTHCTFFARIPHWV